MSEEQASQSLETPNEEVQKDAETEALYDSFGIATKAEKKEIEFPQMDEPSEEQEDEDPATESQPKTIKVKVDKEEREFDISDEKLPEYVQKAYALDRERERKSELERNLDRAAKLAGFENHAEFIANLDKMEQAKETKQQTELDDLKNGLLDEIEAAGIDREHAEKYIENHPLFQEGKRAVEARQKASEQIDEASKWQPLYKAYPELAEAVQKANGQPVEWYTPELVALIERGNDPLLAYEHLNRDKIKESTRKQTEQKLIKQQQLGARGHAEGQEAPSDEVVLSPAQIALAEEFGVNVKAVAQQQKLLKNRR